MAETFNQMIRFPKDLEPQIKAQAEKNGESVNQFVIGAVIAALQPVQPQTVTEQPKETPVAGSKSPIDEKIALMQANERLHALQAKTAAERATKALSAAKSHTLLHRSGHFSDLYPILLILQLTGISLAEQDLALCQINNHGEYGSHPQSLFQLLIVVTTDTGRILHVVR